MLAGTPFVAAELLGGRVAAAAPPAARVGAAVALWSCAALGPQPQVTGVQPSQLEPMVAAEVTVGGHDLFPGMSIELDSRRDPVVDYDFRLRVGQWEGAGEAVEWLSSEELRVDVPGLPAGTYGVQLILPSGRALTVPGVLTVASSSGSVAEPPESTLAPAAPQFLDDPGSDAGETSLDAGGQGSAPGSGEPVADAGSDQPKTLADGGGRREVLQPCGREHFAAPARVEIAAVAASTPLFSPRLDETARGLLFTQWENSIESVYWATRTDSSASFAGLQPVPGFEGFFTRGTLFLSANGQRLYFYGANTDSVADRDLWVAERDPKQAMGFQSVRELSSLNSPQRDDLPTLTSDERLILFKSSRAGGSGGYDLWQATRSTLDTDFGAPTPVVELNTPGIDTGPSISPDGLTLYFSSDRSGGVGSTDLWVATRSSRLEPFASPTWVEGVNSSAQEYDPFVSADGAELYFVTSRNPDPEIWRALRQCP